MGLFGKNHMHCDYTVNTSAPFPTRQIPARELGPGMTVVATPEGQSGVTACCGHWPVITGHPVTQDCDGQLCTYWETDEPGECGGERSCTHRSLADTPITVAA